MGAPATDGYAPVAPAAGAPLPSPENLVIVADGNLIPFMTSKTPAVLVLEHPGFSECEAMRPVLAAAARQHPHVTVYVIEDAEGDGIAKQFPVTTYPTLLFRAPNGTLKRHDGAMSLDACVSELESITALAGN